MKSVWGIAISDAKAVTLTFTNVESKQTIIHLFVRNGFLLFLSRDQASKASLVDLWVTESRVASERVLKSKNYTDELSTGLPLCTWLNYSGFIFESSLYADTVLLLMCV